MTRPTRAAEPCQPHHHHFVRFPPLPLPTAASSTAAVTSGRRAERYSEQEGQEEGGERVARDAGPRGLNHSNIVRPISLPSLPPFPASTSPSS